MATEPVPYLSPEQYLEIEREAEFRHEYYDGEMFLISGGTLNHARIVLNAASELRDQLQGGPCEAVANDLRLWSAQAQAFMYPDIVVTCGPRHFLDNRRDTITDAKAVVEVLSPSTKGFDRGEKFVFCRSLPSFSEYLLIAPAKIGAEHYARQPDGSWLLREFGSRADEIELRSIGCKLSLESLYQRVDFDDSSPA